MIRFVPVLGIAPSTFGESMTPMQKMILCLRREKLKVKLRTLNW
ncbi:hypothetical protein A2U01_0041674, partial [Trifolium medium]|nr:hypothetical protein [Trifolium medium]